MTEPGEMPPPLRAEVLSPPPLGRVELSFEWTYEEFREGLMTSPDAKGGKRPSLIKGLFGWVFFFAMVLFLFLVRRNGTPAVAPTAAAVASGERVDAVIAVAPSATAALVAGVMVAAFTMGIVWLWSPDERRRRRAVRIVVVAFVAVILLGVAGIKFTVAPSLAGRWFVDRAMAVVLAIAPWVLVLIGTILVGVWISRVGMRRRWDGHPHLRRRHTVVLDGAGEQSTNEMTTTFYRWPYFQRAFETPNCLVLIDENDHRHIFPKRVMDPLTADLARSLISNHVANSKFLTKPGGFPVMSTDRG